MAKIKTNEMYRFWVSEDTSDHNLGELGFPSFSDASDFSPSSSTSESTYFSTNLRIMTFNSLAHSLVDLKYEKNDKEIMDWAARKMAILDVIQKAKAHIVCLQEIDANDYSDFFIHKFKQLGYEGIYKQKNGRKDGLAILYNSEIFDVLFVDCFDYPLPSTSQVAIVLSLVVKQQNLELKSLANLDQIGGEKGNNTSKIATFSGFSSLTICNTHLLFNRKRGDIKLFQLINLLSRVKQMEDRCRDYFNARGMDYVPSTFICGDFNFTPQSPLYKFLNRGYIDLSKMRVDQLSGQHLMFEHSYNVYSHGHHHSGSTIPNKDGDDVFNPSHLSSYSVKKILEEDQFNECCIEPVEYPANNLCNAENSNANNTSSESGAQLLYDALQNCSTLGLFKRVPEYLKLRLMKSLGDITPDTVSSDGKATSENCELNFFPLFESKHPTVLYCPLKLRSAYSSFDPYLRTYQEPAFTAFHGWQRGCIDYIWYTPESVQVKAIFNMPSYGEVTSYGNLPNKGWPASDHFSLVSEFVNRNECLKNGKSINCM